MTTTRFEIVRPLPRQDGAPPSATAPLADHAAWHDADLRGVADEIAEVHEHGPKARRVCTTGIPSLDDLIGGWMPGQTYIVAGKTASGKTSFATHSTLVLATLAAQFGFAPVLYFSLEMTRVDMAHRTLAWLTRIPQDLVQRASYQRTLTDAQVHAISVAHARIAQRIRLVSTTDASVTAIRAQARAEKAAHGCSAIVVDYLGLIEAEKGRDRGATREREVAFASRGLRAMAMELDVPVIVLCQLGRRADKEPEPHLSMLRESGSIENDASGAVLFLWPKPDGSGTRIVVAKRRFGKAWVETTVRFDGATGTFEDLDDGTRRSDPEALDDDHAI